MDFTRGKGTSRIGIYTHSVLVHVYTRHDCCNLICNFLRDIVLHPLNIALLLTEYVLLCTSFFLRRNWNHTRNCSHPFPRDLIGWRPSLITTPLGSHAAYCSPRTTTMTITKRGSNQDPNKRIKRKYWREKTQWWELPNEIVVRGDWSRKEKSIRFPIRGVQMT